MFWIIAAILFTISFFYHIRKVNSCIEGKENNYTEEEIFVEEEVKPENINKAKEF